MTSSQIRAASQTGASAQTAVPGSAMLNDQVYSRLLRARVIFLGSEIDDPVANTITAQLLLLGAADPGEDIWLYINSPGGSISAGMAVYDAMQWVRNDICTVAIGMAASMGQFLLCAGAPGKRYALPHAQVVMHQPHGGIAGTASDVKIQAEQMLYIKLRLAELIAMHTGQDVLTIERDSDRDRWFTAQQAKQYGLVDHVVSSVNQVQGGGTGALG